FRELCLYTVSIRGQTQTVPDYFTPTILGVQDIPKSKKDDDLGSQVEMFVILDQDVPNTKGHLVATIKGRIYDQQEFKIQPDPDKKTAQAPKLGQSAEFVTTNRLKLVFVIGKQPGAVHVADKDDVFKDLFKQTVKLKLDNFVPSPP